MPVPDYQSIMLPFLQGIADGKEHVLRDLIDSLGDHFQLSDSERQEMLPNGTSEGYLAAVELLLESGSNPELESQRGNTAKAIALSNAPRHGDRRSVNGKNVYPLLDTAFKTIAKKLTQSGHHVDG